jgi:hypothetical protein
MVHLILVDLCVGLRSMEKLSLLLFLVIRFLPITSMTSRLRLGILVSLEFSLLAPSLIKCLLMIKIP